MNAGVIYWNEAYIQWKVLVRAESLRSEEWSNEESSQMNSVP